VIRDGDTGDLLDAELPFRIEAEPPRIELNKLLIGDLADVAADAAAAADLVGASDLVCDADLRVLDDVAPASPVPLLLIIFVFSFFFFYY